MFSDNEDKSFRDSSNFKACSVTKKTKNGFHDLVKQVGCRLPESFVIVTCFSGTLLVYGIGTPWEQHFVARDSQNHSIRLQIWILLSLVYSVICIYYSSCKTLFVLYIIDVQFMNYNLL